jgi:quercetin dioxygenase-like cupin family protein
MRTGIRSLRTKQPFAKVHETPPPAAASKYHRQKEDVAMKRSSLFMVCLTLFLAGGALAQQPMGQNVSEMKLTTFPGMPTCVKGAVMTGDPTKGSSIIYSKIAAGCTIPWHWHTPNEHIMVVTGTMRMEMKDGKPLTLHAGAFSLLPSHHAHQASCAKTCTIYVYSDAAFDIHFINAAGSEITPADALEPLKESAAKPPS